MSEKNLRVEKQILAVAILLGLLALLANHVAMASGAEEYVQDNCAGCHAVSKPDFDAMDITERARRKGPHLYYAGDKFRKEWLQTWLVAPDHIRPGGSFPPDHTVVTDEGDVIDEDTLAVHPSVPEAMAAGVAEWLMGLHMEDAPLLDAEYTPKKVSPMLGKMNFNKFKGCAACHRDEDDTGGLSGPELYTAWNRMQPEFIVSYIKNPAAWDPHSMMPNRHLNEPEIHKLVDYLKLIGENSHE